MAKKSTIKQKNDKKPVGRPTLYNEELLAKTIDYVNSFVSTEDVPIPTVATLAQHLGISRSRVYVWSKHQDKGEFRDSLERLMATQEVLLFSGGLTGRFNPAICKLMLHNHGYSDKKVTTHRG